MVENVLINGSCSGSMIHPGLFEIIFTSLTLPPCTKAIQIADSPGNFQGIYRPGGGGVVRGFRRCLRDHRYLRGMPRLMLRLGR